MSDGSSDALAPRNAAANGAVLLQSKTPLWGSPAPTLLLRRKSSSRHAVTREHLDPYLNEFTFRFNRRRSRRRGLLFYRLLEQAIFAEPITYKIVPAVTDAWRPQTAHSQRCPFR